MAQTQQQQHMHTHTYGAYTNAHTWRFGALGVGKVALRWCGRYDTVGRYFICTRRKRDKLEQTAPLPNGRSCVWMWQKKKQKNNSNRNGNGDKAGRMRLACKTYNNGKLLWLEPRNTATATKTYKWIEACTTTMPVWPKEKRRNLKA